MEGSRAIAGNKGVADRSDIPGIIAPVPFVLLAAVGLRSVIDHLLKNTLTDRAGNQEVLWIGFVGSIARPWRATIAVVLALAGVWLVWESSAAFRRLGTHARPWYSTSSLARDGIYARVRNPMYLGFFSCALGLAFLLRSDGSVILMVLAALLVHYGVVLREERYLERNFGEDYRAYKRAVPRY